MRSYLSRETASEIPETTVARVAHKKPASTTRRRFDELEAYASPGFYAKGALICSEGHLEQGIFIVRSGCVKLSLCSREGRTVNLCIAEPGYMIGLTGLLSDSLYEITAEALEPSRVDFIRKADFFRLLKNSPKLRLQVTAQLGRQCHHGYENIRCIGLCESIPARMARLILQWAQDPVFVTRATAQPSIQVALTHEEISHFVGSTRETVSRILKDFRTRRWIRAKGTAWTIANKAALQNIAGVD